jgi:hypothetical protein
MRCFKQIIPVVLITSLSCVESYTPPLDQNLTDILVVDGFINLTQRTASVKLSRTQFIYDEEAPPTETGANVSIEISSGDSFSLPEVGPGTYTASTLLLDKSALYTLHISTQAGTEYRSDPIRVLETPPIEGLSVGISNGGNDLNILIDTKDESGNTRYYSWQYEETYEYHAAFASGFTFNNKIPEVRKAEDRIDRCWRTDFSSQINIASTDNLSEDILRRHPLTSISKESPKISVRYSILVRQRALSASEYSYLSELQKTTEELGGLFDTPTIPVVGNIKQINDANMPVLGYFSGSEVMEKRFFVNRADIPDQLLVPPPKFGCITETTCLIDGSTAGGPESCARLENLSESSILVTAVSGGLGGPVVAYTFTTQECGDCRLRGGTTERPVFW